MFTAHIVECLIIAAARACFRQARRGQTVLMTAYGVATKKDAAAIYGVASLWPGVVGDDAHRRYGES